ncbi:Histone-lysine N-methyltransferase [Wickerhamomyces ciferrii]|uniref:Histone-lysine N-methyltransferase n=1 Tax=Wickerhamomyces ciferrii (strain ATCC 14091 / BCRC 22168 / CBS 111 / JCM 3599 / NBRC 0793 / NRRL Y-1031 F-60-10) TaxID=1206466 RepID=K0KEV0_WICCF|nr:Histone-lysine N-methyltransferase [Wickerhamomyces ciferrii]CCH43660.1 Histone-lysine N-methyltransferase [Wickerhamomyces ciferrii]
MSDKENVDVPVVDAEQPDKVEGESIIDQNEHEKDQENQNQVDQDPKDGNQSNDQKDEPKIVDNQANNDYGDLPPGTIVLGKLKSFPPWPGIVVPFELIPESIQKVKPKPKPPVVHHAKNKRRSLAKVDKNEPFDSRLWCVRFLKDDTFMWGGVKDISILSKDQIEKFLNDKKGKKLIKSAYEMALNPPDLEEFIIWGSNGKPIEIDNEANDADFEEGEDDVQDEDQEDDGDDEDEVEDEDLEELKESKKRTKTTKARRGRPPAKKSKTTKGSTPKKSEPVKEKKKPGRKKKIVEASPEPEPEPETSGDEDWDVIDETEPPVAIEIPSAKVLGDELKKKTPLIKKARITLQDYFLEEKELSKDSKNLKQISSILESLEKITNVQTSLIKHYNLHKVLIDILKRPDLNEFGKEIKNFRNRIESLVQNWFNIEIQPNERWDFTEKNDEQESQEGQEQDAQDGTNEIKDEVKDENHATENSEAKESEVKEENKEDNKEPNGST